MSAAPAFCGFLNVLKPPGMSSAHVVGYVRHLLGGAKAGHAGTLDPEAAGVLPIMVGKAARLFDYMQDKEKAYVAEAAFGASTDTQDAQGVVLETGDRYPSAENIELALKHFTGTIFQTPPMYSALKVEGRRLYDLARQGQSAAVAAREVTVYELSLRGITERHGAMLFVRCSKGFYVRTLCHDLGRALNCPAHMRFLLRTQSGPFTLSTAHTLEALTAAAAEGTLSSMLLPSDAALSHLPRTELPQSLYEPLRNGIPQPWSRFQSLAQTAAADGAPFRCYLEGALMAVAERSADGAVRFRTWLGEDGQG